MIDICELAVNYGFKPVITGGLEAWIVAGRLSQAGAQVVFTPRQKVHKDTTVNRLNGYSPETAKIMYDHGVNFAILPSNSSIAVLYGDAGRDLAFLPLEAAFAVRGGLSKKAAVESITINAARLLGVDKRIGSIEMGKDADLIVVDGDLLHYNTMVQWAIVNGRLVYDKEAESLMSHIRPRDGSDGKVIEFWPRPIDIMPDFLKPDPKEEEKKETTEEKNK